MSEVSRFLNAITNDTDMKGEVETLKGFAAIASYARGKGYNISENDLRDALPEGKDLSEVQLDKIAAGHSRNVLNPSD